MSKFENHPLNPGEGIPVFISAGVIKEPTQLEQFYEITDSRTAPVITLGGYTITEWAGNAKAGQDDFIYYPDRKMAGNARGLPNGGRNAIEALKDPIARLTDLGIKTIVQVTNLPFETPIDVIPELVEIAASVNPTAVEVNLSCPNGKNADGSFHPPLSSNAEASGEVMQASRNRVGREVILGAKDSPHVTSLDDEVNRNEVILLSHEIKKYIDFIVGINTIGNQEFPELECGNGRGGMSGPVVADIAKEHLSIWQEFAPNLAYLSTGGIDSENAESEISARLEAGALLVGGAQEFYRTKSQLQLVANWAIASA